MCREREKHVIYSHLFFSEVEKINGHAIFNNFNGVNLSNDVQVYGWDFLVKKMNRNYC